MVFIIISVLLGTWATRFKVVQHEAQLVMLQRMASHMRMAAELFHMQCLASGAAGSQACDQLTVGQFQVQGRYQYPAATADGIARLVGLSPNDPAAAHFEVRSMQEQATSVLSVRVRPQEEGACELQYRQAPQPGLAPTVLLSPLSCH